MAHGWWICIRQAPIDHQNHCLYGSKEGFSQYIRSLNFHIPAQIEMVFLNIAKLGSLNSVSALNCLFISDSDISSAAKRWCEERWRRWTGSRQSTHSHWHQGIPSQMPFIFRVFEALRWRHYRISRGEELKRKHVNPRNTISWDKWERKKGWKEREAL